MSTSDDDGIFSTQEYRDLILRLCAGNGAAGMKIDEIRRLVTWAEDTARDYALLDLLRKGYVTVHWPDGAQEPLFRARDAK